MALIKKSNLKEQILEETTILVVRETALSRVSEPTSILVMNLEDQTVYELSHMAAYVWSLVDGTRTVSQILKEASKGQSKKNPSLEKFVKNLLADFFLKNLVTKLHKKLPKQRCTFDLKLKFIKKDKKNLKMPKTTSLSQRYLVAGAGTASTSKCH